MLGLIVVVLVVLVVAAAAMALVRQKMSVPVLKQEGWWRVLPDGSKPTKTGKARSFYAVAKIAKKTEGIKSFNYNTETGKYELFDKWLVNFTQPMDIEGTQAPYTIKRGPHVTGVLIPEGGGKIPFPCCAKIKCEMAAFGLDATGALHPSRDLDADPYYDVAKAAATWPGKKNSQGKIQATPPAAGANAMGEFVDHDLTRAVKEAGKAPVGLNPDGTIKVAEDSGTCGGEDCDFCIGCGTPTAEGAAVQVGGEDGSVRVKNPPRYSGEDEVSDSDPGSGADAHLGGARGDAVREQP
jgi:hypothetical protein